MNFKVVIILVSLAIASKSKDVHYGHYEDKNCPSYIGNTYYFAAPNCAKLHSLAINISTFDGLYSGYELHFNPIMSRYYAARLAQAFNYKYHHGCADANELKDLDVMTPWSGLFGAIAVDGAKGFDRVFLRRCTFPNEDWPFLCRGDDGSGGAIGGLLQTLSYIPILHDDERHKWTLFTHCWNAKTPTDPDAEEIATSFNVFSLESNLTDTDRDAIIAKLHSVGFDTSSKNLIESDYTGPTV